VINCDPSLAFDFAADLLDPPSLRKRLKPYEYDWVAAAHDFFVWPEDESLKEYQEEILAAIPVYKKVCVRSIRGAGKTGTMAMATLIFALTRDGDDWKIPQTASKFKQLTHYLWPEIRKWTRRIKWDVVGRAPFDNRWELQKYGLHLSTGSAFPLASDDPDGMEGGHASRFFAEIDEGKAVAPPVFDSIEGMLSNANNGRNEAYVLCASTPGEPSGRFYDIQSRKPGYEDWHVIRITLERVLAAGMVTNEWVEQRARQWGRSSAMFQNQVLGEFAKDAIDGLIPLQWVEAAQDRWEGYPYENRTRLSVVGIDVARSGQDKTVFAKRYGQYIAQLKAEHIASTTEVAGIGKELLRGTDAYASVDVIGIGAGVVDTLRDNGVDTEAFNASKSSTGTDFNGLLEFANRRAEAWWALRDALDPKNGFELALPPDDELLGDLTSPRYRRLPTGKIRVEEKDEVKKRLGRSPDRGDAVVMTLAPRYNDDNEEVYVYDDEVSISLY
jgi:hypothetical protein